MMDSHGAWNHLGGNTPPNLAVFAAVVCSLRGSLVTGYSSRMRELHLPALPLPSVPLRIV